MTAIGVDVGGTKLLAVRVDARGGVLEEHVSPSPTDGAALVRQVITAATELGDPESIGVGVPGVVDRRGTLVFAPNLQGSLGVRLQGELESRLPGVRVWVGNDANAACWGEHSVGAGAGSESMIMITLGTGIGGGVVVDGHLYAGGAGFAGEFGHMTVMPNGLLCPCGKKGCWERYASGAGLGILGREKATAGGAPGITGLAGGDPEAVKGEHVTAAAAAGDPDAIDIMGRFGWWVGLGIANLVAAWDPEVVVVGGGLVEAGEVLLGPARSAVNELVAGAGARPEVEVLAAQLGARAGAIGAALLGQG